MKGLILLGKSANLILDGKKTVEIRSTKTLKRERIGIIISGTKKVWGTVEIYDCIKLNKELFEDLLRDKHCSNKSYEELLKIYPKPYAWLLRNSEKFNEPIDYVHKQGCITWVNLD